MFLQICHYIKQLLLFFLNVIKICSKASYILSAYFHISCQSINLLFCRYFIIYASTYGRIDNFINMLGIA